MQFKQQRAVYIHRNECAALNLLQPLCIVALQCLGDRVIIINPGSRSSISLRQKKVRNVLCCALTAPLLTLLSLLHSLQWTAAGPCGRSGRPAMCRVGGVSRSDLEPVPTRRLSTAALSARACLCRRSPATHSAQVSFHSRKFLFYFKFI